MPHVASGRREKAKRSQGLIELVIHLQRIPRTGDNIELYQADTISKNFNCGKCCRTCDPVSFLPEAAREK